MSDVATFLKSVPEIKNQVLHTPFGLRLPVAGFLEVVEKKNISLRPIPLIFKENLSRLTLSSSPIFLFIDDYFIYEAYWRGDFWRSKKIEARGVKVELIKVFHEDSPNVGRLFKVTRENKN
jgi:hypothetical protein